MSAQLILASLLCVIGLIWLIAEVVWPAADSSGGKVARFALLIGCGFTFYLFAFPPQQTSSAQTLVVLTSSADLTAESELTDGERVVALPEFDPPASAEPLERAPDLATALRRNPAVTGLRVAGDGLVARDLAVAATLPVEYAAAAGRDGIVELRAPAIVAPGALWTVGGRVAGYPQTQLELLDPQGNVLAQTPVSTDGQFKLFASTPTAGQFRYQLRLVAEDRETPVEQLSVPVAVQTPRQQQIVLLSGAPNAEAKFLRRWAVDSGLQLVSAINLRPRLSMRLGNPQLSPERLAQADLLIVDDRSWYRLGSAQRGMVSDAVDAGLGLLLRLTDEPTRGQREPLAELGFSVVDAQISRQALLPALTTGTAPALDQSSPQLTRRLVEVQAARATALLVDQQGAALGMWRPQGDGRVGMLWVGDTYSIALQGDRVRYASLWSRLVATLARAQQNGQPELIGEHHWVNQRMTWCELAGDAVVISPSGEATDLRNDEHACAGYWSAAPGWHRLRVDETEFAFYVRAADDGGALGHQQLIAQNLSLAAEQPLTRATDLPAYAGPRWPWFLLWLALSGALWWLERRVGAMSRLA